MDLNIVFYGLAIENRIEREWQLLDALADHPHVIGIAMRDENCIQLVSASDDIALDVMCQSADSWILTRKELRIDAVVPIPAGFALSDSLTLSRMDWADTQRKLAEEREYRRTGSSST